ncbi:hypothetical protein PsYK624_149510 [Phanerochaete sordida]|uniref:Uncharacterized protein n=1 Tax=Phanerochaete sordida TaxID=48140 RepID=A0A9P3GPX8_9APHY|nr:hypothetical protein PsYK624_149510 [Phanerochaete sordida]
MIFSAAATFLALSVAAIAAPISPAQTVALHHRAEYDGIEICGVQGRENGLDKKCLLNPLQFYIENGQFKSSTKAGPKIDETAQCDHSLELQVLARSLENYGACRALNAIVSAAGLTGNGGSEFKKTVMLPLLQAINDQSNAVWLPQSVNSVKGAVVKSALGNGGDTDASPATLANVKTYFADPRIHTKTVALAAQLDTLTGQMLTAAAAAGNRALDANTKLGSGRGASAKKTAQERIAAAVTTWQDAFTAHHDGVASEWQIVMDHVAAHP